MSCSIKVWGNTMPVVLETRDASLRAKLVRLFDEVDSTGSEHKSKTMKLEGDLEITSSFTAPEGTRVYMNSREEISLHIPPSGKRATYMTVSVRADNTVIVRDKSKK